MMSRLVDEKFSLNGRVALLTGGGGMLGREFTRVLLEAGATVVVADLSLEAATQVVGEVSVETGGQAMPLLVDVSDGVAVTNAVDQVLAQHGRLDILVNNAAIDPKFDADVRHLQSSGFEDYPLEAWQKSLDVNLTGAFLCSQAAGRVMVRQNSGVIVNVCSIYGLVAPDQRLYAPGAEGEPAQFKPPSYAVAKAGLAQLTRYLAAYWSGTGIRVNSLTPGGIHQAQDEEFVRRYSSRTPLGRMADRTEMSAGLLFLASDASSYMTGGNLIIDGGWTAW